MGTMLISGTLGLFAGNIGNLITVRMQNVDYRLQKGVFGAVKDLFLVDKHRMLYKGLFPIMVACQNLAFFPMIMEQIYQYDFSFSRQIWPLAFGICTLFVHPWFLIGMRVQCSHLTLKTAKEHRNTFSTIHNIFKN